MSLCKGPRDVAAGDWASTPATDRFPGGHSPHAAAVAGTARHASSVPHHAWRAMRGWGSYLPAVSDERTQEEPRGGPVAENCPEAGKVGDQESGHLVHHERPSTGTPTLHSYSHNDLQKGNENPSLFCQQPHPSAFDFHRKCPSSQLSYSTSPQSVYQ